MALGTATIDKAYAQGDTKLIAMHFAGDGATPAGGTTAFAAYVQTAIKLAAAAATDKNVRGASTVEVMGIALGPCGVYRPVYDKANDKLKIYDEKNVEATGNLSGTTYYMLVICK
jgi:hypothetical protein